MAPPTYPGPNGSFVTKTAVPLHLWQNIGSYDHVADCDYLPARSRRPTQSWRTFLRNQAFAFGHHQYPQEHFDTEYLSLRVCPYWGSLMRSVAQIARLSAGLCRWHAHQTLTPTVRRIPCVAAGAHEALCTAAHGKRAAIVFRPPSPCEVRRPMKLGRHQGRGRPRLRMLLFSRESSFEKGQAVAFRFLGELRSRAKITDERDQHARGNRDPSLT